MSIEITLTVVVRGETAPGDAVRIANVALNLPRVAEVRIEKKELPYGSERRLGGVASGGFDPERGSGAG